jgi:hypothetical protein
VARVIAARDEGDLRGSLYTRKKNDRKKPVERRILNQKWFVCRFRFLHDSSRARVVNGWAKNGCLMTVWARRGRQQSRSVLAVAADAAKAASSGGRAISSVCITVSIGC